MDEFEVFETEAQTEDVAVEENVSPKSRLTTVLLTFLLGIVGVDLFYKGKTGLGVLQAIIFAVFLLIKSPFLLIGIFMLIIPVAGWFVSFVMFAVALVITIPEMIWPLIRGIMALCGTATDKQGRKIKVWKQKK